MGAPAGASAADTAARLGRLAARSLLTVSKAGVSFHDLQREFLLLHTEDLSLAHADLLAAYRALLPPGSGWARLPPDEPYIWDNLMYHLRGAGDGAAIQAVACDLAWIARRCFRGGPYAAESDLRQAAALYPEHEGIGWLLRLLTQWGHLLTGTPRSATWPPRWPAGCDAPASVDAEGWTPCSRVVTWRRGGACRAPGLASPASWKATPAGSTGWRSRPDGRLLASGGDDGTVRLWDPATGRPAATLEGHTGWVTQRGVLPGRADAGQRRPRRTVRLWDPATGQLIATLEATPAG